MATNNPKSDQSNQGGQKQPQQSTQGQNQGGQQNQSGQQKQQSNQSGQADNQSNQGGSNVTRPVEFPREAPTPERNDPRAAGREDKGQSGNRGEAPAKENPSGDRSGGDAGGRGR